MTDLITRFRLYLRERRFRRSLDPGAVSRNLRLRHHAVEHGAKGAGFAAEPAAAEDAVDVWGVATVAERHQLRAQVVGRAHAALEKSRFGAAEKGFSNILQRFAAKVKKALAEAEVRLREAHEQLTAAAVELKRHCLAIGAPETMTYSERTDRVWFAFFLAVTIDALGGSVATVGELGLPLSLILCAVLGAVIFALGCGAGWARRHAWVSPRAGWSLFGLSLASTVAILLVFCAYRLKLAAIAAETTGLAAPDRAEAATLPPLVLLLAVAGLVAWGVTLHSWLTTYGVAPGVRDRQILRKRALAKCRAIIEGSRNAILLGAQTADGQVDGACADALARRGRAPVHAAQILALASDYDRDRESIFAAWGAAHAEFAGVVAQMTGVPRAPRALRGEYPVIPTAHVPATVDEVQLDADTLLLDEGRGKLAIAATATAGLRDLARIAASVPDLTLGRELLK